MSGEPEIPEGLSEALPVNSHGLNCIQGAEAPAEKEDMGPDVEGEAAKGCEIRNRQIVEFEPGDPANPHNWSMLKKMSVAILAIVITLNSTLGSSMPSGAIEYIAEEFNVTNEEQLVMPISVFLIGYIVGPLFLSPLSEQFGRRPLLVTTFFLYFCFTLGSALVNNFPGFLVLRFLAGTVASAPLTVIGGVFADMFTSPVHRGHMMALFGAGTTFGPTLSPIISGFTAQVSWRWPFWVEVIVAGATLIPAVFLPETFSPVILSKRAAAMRKEQNRDDIVSASEADGMSMKQVFAITLTRPIKMLFTEWIVSVVSIYMAVVYAILYLFFQAYPIIFKGVYGFAPGIDGLPYLPLGIGTLISSTIIVLWDTHIHRKKERNPGYVVTPEYHRLRLAIAGGPLMVMSLFWLGWTAKKSIHWMVPIVAGLPFGIGMGLIFMALLNYLGDSYQIFSASAMATAACTRSIMGALLPLAAKPMYGTLGIGWATSLLGFISLALSGIPFVFAMYGERIRLNSPFCQALLKKQREAAGVDDFE